jgi:uncharacterized protein (UPF0264 family)
MTRLLVSVRDADEARLAVEVGVDLVDVKEPHAGPLGAATSETIAEIARVVGGRRPLSVALGELDDFERSPRVLPAGVGFAKLGLARCAGRCDWPGRWQRVLESLPAGVAPVAVIYADHEQARSPAARPILAQAIKLGCRGVLVDTFDKRGGGLVEHWPIDQIAWLVRAAHEAGLLAVLAGRLTIPVIGELLPLEPDYIAVRGAACAADRAGTISAQRLVELVELVSRGNGASTLSLDGTVPIDRGANP